MVKYGYGRVRYGYGSKSVRLVDKFGETGVLKYEIIKSLLLSRINLNIVKFSKKKSSLKSIFIFQMEQSEKKIP